MQRFWCNITSDLFLTIIIFLIIPCSCNICPQEDHAVCNINYPSRTCLCSLISPSTEPPSKISCNQVVDIANTYGISLHLTDGNVVSIDQELNRTDDSFPERKIRSAIAWALSVKEYDLVFLRVRCTPMDVNVNQTLIVQFGVLFGNASAGKNWTVRAAKRISDMRSAFDARIVPLKLINAESIAQFIQIEADANNRALILQAFLAVLFIIISVLGAAYICKKQLEERRRSAAAAAAKPPEPSRPSKLEQPSESRVPGMITLTSKPSTPTPIPAASTPIPAITASTTSDTVELIDEDEEEEEEEEEEN